MARRTLTPGNWAADSDWKLWDEAHTVPLLSRPEATFGEAELPGGIDVPSPWLKVAQFTGQHPGDTDSTVHEVFVDITAFTDDTAAQAHVPVQTPFSNTNPPIDLVLLLDLSGSTNEISPVTNLDKGTMVKQIGGQVGSAVLESPGSRVALITFDRPDGEADPGYRLDQAFTGDPDTFTAALAASYQHAFGQTHMDEAISLAQGYAETDATQQVVVLLVTDGQWTQTDPDATVRAMVAAHPDWLFYVADIQWPGDPYGVYHAEMVSWGGLGSGYFPIVHVADYDTVVLAIEPDPYDPLEVALSADGVTPIGDTWYVFTTSDVVKHTCGHAAYLWGSAWQPDDFTGTFSVLVRRPEPKREVSSQYVTDARVRFTALSPGGNITMPVRQELTEVVLLGVEATPGQLATSLQRLRALNYKMRPNTNMKKFRPQGEKMNDIAIPVREWTTGSISGLLDYNEAPLTFEAIMGAGVHGGAGVVNQANTHVYNLDNRVRSICKSYSLQRGQRGNQCEGALYLMHNALQLQINTDDCQISGGFYAQIMDEGVTLQAGADEKQRETVTGTPTAGTFKLGFRGAVTPALAYGANAAARQAAMEALSTIGSGNVAVTGTGPFDYDFGGGALAGQRLPLIYVAANNLNAGATIAITEPTIGGWPEVPLVPVLPGHWSVYMADTDSGLIAGKLDKSIGVAATGIDIGNRSAPFWTLDRDLNGTWTDWVEVDPTFKANLLIGANSTGMGLLSTMRAGAPKLLMMEAIGPVIGSTSDHHKMIWKGYAKVDDTADFSTDQGRVTYPWPLEWCEGPNGEVPTLTVQNGIVSY